MKEGHYPYNCPLRKAASELNDESEQNKAADQEQQRKEQGWLTQTSESGSTQKEEVKSVRKPKKQQTVLKLTAGRFELTRNPKSDGESSTGNLTEYYSNKDSSDSEAYASDKESNKEDETNSQYSSMSAKSPSPSLQSAKRKQKEGKHKRRRRRDSRK